MSEASKSQSPINTSDPLPESQESQFSWFSQSQIHRGASFDDPARSIQQVSYESESKSPSGTKDQKSTSPAEEEFSWLSPAIAKKVVVLKEFLTSKGRICQYGVLEDVLDQALIL